VEKTTLEYEFDSKVMKYKGYLLVLSRSMVTTFGLIRSIHFPVSTLTLRSVALALVMVLDLISSLVRVPSVMVWFLNSPSNLLTLEDYENV